MNETVDNLPNTLGELLRIALEDFKKVAAEGKYGIDMRTYIDLEYDEGASKRCVVCLAGAVLVTRIAPGAGLELARDVMNRLREDTLYKLCAIDALRSGRLASAYGYLYGFRSKNVDECSALSVKECWMKEHPSARITHYIGDGPESAKDKTRREMFVMDLTRLADDLVAVGI